MDIPQLRQLAKYGVERLMAHGATKAQCKSAYEMVDELNVDAGEFSLMRTTYDSRIILTAIVDNRKSTIGANNIDLESIDKAAKECVEQAKISFEDDCYDIAELEENQDFVEGVLEPDRDKFFFRINEYLSDMAKDYPKVLVEQLIANYYFRRTVFANSNGVDFGYTGGNYSLSNMYSAHEGEKTTSFNCLGTDFLDLEERLLDKGNQRLMYALCEKELEAVPFEGKYTGKVIVAPSCISDIVSGAVDSFTGDSDIVENTSPWRNKLNERVASEKLTYSIIPIDERVIGGERFTFEGYKTENCCVIRDGVLENFTLSAYGARKSGEKRCSTQSGCVEIKPGDTPYEDMIKSIDRGILICRLSGGSPAGNGDFSAVAKNSFLIENGKITSPILETMISGNLSDMLMNIIDISKETVEDGSCVLPWISFDGVTVSGK